MKEEVSKICKYIQNEILRLKRLDRNIIKSINICVNQSNLTEEELLEILQEKKDELIYILADSQSNDVSKIYIIFNHIKQAENIQYAGCYTITNKKTKGVYIGESIDIFNRIQKHIGDLYEGKHHCPNLQESFNETRHISDFTIKPLYIFPITNFDRVKIKIDTLYLEAAYYLNMKYKGVIFYNYDNPFTELINHADKENKFGIKNSEVLKRLYVDKYDVILRSDLKQKIQKRILEVVSVEEVRTYLEKYTNNTAYLLEPILNKSRVKKEKNITVKIEQKTDKNYPRPEIPLEMQALIGKAIKRKASGEFLYRIIDLLNSFKENGILPHNYRYSKVRNVLIDHNIILLDSKGRTVATDYSINNDLYIPSSASFMQDNQSYKYSYYITEKGKEKIKEIILSYPADYFSDIIM